MELIHEQISRAVIGAAMRVLNTLTPGLDEKIYERALRLELKSVGYEVESQRQFPVRYRGTIVGTLIPDLIVGNQVIVDPKIAAAFNDSHIAQMTGYLAITGMRLGFLVNFKSAELTWKRIVR